MAAGKGFYRYKFNDEHYFDICFVGEDRLFFDNSYTPTSISNSTLFLIMLISFLIVHLNKEK